MSAWKPLVGIALTGAVWALTGTSCVLEELTTDNLCGLFVESVSESCATCSQAACCDEERACRDSAECAELYECLGPCAADAECVSACAQRHANDAAAAALASCHATNCYAACASCAGGFSGANPACDDCTRDKCCEAISTCIENAKCVEIMQCIAGCCSSGCTQACLGIEFLENDAESVAITQAALNCQKVECKTPCALGRSWDCVGAFDWPLPEQGTDTVDVVFSAIDGAGPRVTDVTVTVCGAIDVACDTPVFTTSTAEDDDTFLLAIPVGFSGFRGFIEVLGTDRVPTLFFQNEPIYRPVRRGAPSLTQAQLDLFATSVGETLDPTLGHLQVLALDCQDNLGVGVQFDIGDAEHETTIYHYGAGQTSTTSDPARIGNIVPGAVTLTASLEDGGKTIAAMNVQIRTGALTVVTMSADPLQ